jgi:hypothetical protein
MKKNVVKSALHGRIFYYASRIKTGKGTLSLSKNVGFVISPNIFCRETWDENKKSGHVAHFAPLSAS